MASGDAAIIRRKERIEFAKKLTMNANGDSYKRMIGVVSYNLGVRKERAKEYLEVLKDMGFFKVEKGNILIPKQE